MKGLGSVGDFFGFNFVRMSPFPPKSSISCRGESIRLLGESIESLLVFREILL